MSDLLLISFARFLFIVGQLVYIKMFTNYLNAHELGVYYFLTTLSYSLNALVFVPVDYFQQAKIYKYIDNGTSLWGLLLFNGRLLLLVSIGLMIGLSFIILIYPYEAINLLLVVMMSFALYTSQALRGLINNLEHKRVAAISIAFEAMVKIFIFWLLLQFMVPNAVTLLVSWIISCLLVISFLGSQAHKLNVFAKFGKAAPKITFSEVFHFGYPISVGAIFNWFQLQGYRLVLVPLGLSTTVGIYATIANIGSAGMGGASSIFVQMFVPNIYKTFGQYTKIYLRNAVILVLFILMFSLVFADIIVALVANTNFVKYSWVLFFGVIAEGGNFLIGALSIHITITASTKRMIVASIIGVASMSIVFSGIYYWGYINVETVGIPIAVSQILTVAYLYFIFRRPIAKERLTTPKNEQDQQAPL